MALVAACGLALAALPHVRWWEHNITLMVPGEFQRTLVFTAGGFDGGTHKGAHPSSDQPRHACSSAHPLHTYKRPAPPVAVLPCPAQLHEGPIRVVLQESCLERKHARRQLRPLATSAGEATLDGTPPNGGHQAGLALPQPAQASSLRTLGWATRLL